MSENINQNSQSESQALPMNYALWADRVIAALIDLGLAFLFMVVLFVLMWVVLLILSTVGGGLMSTETDIGLAIGSLMSFGWCGICCWSFVLPPISYFVLGIFNKAIWVSQRGYSIGQGIMRLRVVDADGKFIPMGTAWLRLFCQIGIALIPILGPLSDIVYPLFNEPERQTLHDRAAGTFVIKTDEPPDFFPKKGK